MINEYGESLKRVVTRTTPYPSFMKGGDYELEACACNQLLFTNQG